MKKYGPKYLKPTIFDPKDHWMVGIVWPVKGSKGNEYNVELHDKGFACECTGFSFHGKCKHSMAVLNQVQQAMA
jgi:hypothetical protein